MLKDSEKRLYFNLTICTKDLVQAFGGLRSNIKEKLKIFEFLSINQLLQKASVIKSRSNIGEFHMSYPPNMHAIKYYSDGPNHESTDYFITAGFLWQIGQHKLNQFLALRSS